MNASRSFASRLARASLYGAPSHLHQCAPLARGLPRGQACIDAITRSPRAHGRELASSVAAAGGPIPEGAKRKSLAALGGFTYPGPRKLADIVKLPLLNAHDAAKVKEIWTEYHKHHATSISDHISREEFGLYMQRSQRCPLFVIPIPKCVCGDICFALVSKIFGSAFCANDPVSYPVFQHSLVLKAQRLYDSHRSVPGTELLGHVPGRLQA